MLRIDHQRARSREAEPGAIEAFLNASQAIRFEGENREQVYGWVEQVLRQQQYRPARPQGAGPGATLP